MYQSMTLQRSALHTRFSQHLWSICASPPDSIRVKCPRGVAELSSAFPFLAQGWMFYAHGLTTTRLIRLLLSPFIDYTMRDDWLTPTLSY